MQLLSFLSDLGDGALAPEDVVGLPCQEGLAGLKDLRAGEGNPTALSPRARRRTEPCARPEAVAVAGWESAPPSSGEPPLTCGLYF